MGGWRLLLARAGWYMRRPSGGPAKAPLSPLLVEKTRFPGGRTAGVATLLFIFIFNFFMLPARGLDAAVGHDLFLNTQDINKLDKRGRRGWWGKAGPSRWVRTWLRPLQGPELRRLGGSIRRRSPVLRLSRMGRGNAGKTQPEHLVLRPVYLVAALLGGERRAKNPFWKPQACLVSPAFHGRSGQRGSASARVPAAPWWLWSLSLSRESTLSARAFSSAALYARPESAD